jgi:hypothetical protein
MNAFMHLIFPRRNTRVQISKKGKSLRIVIEDGIAERLVIEVSSMGELDLKGLSTNG